MKTKHQSITDKKREYQLKNTYFNRYMLLRYSLAGFFFANLYWVLGLLFEPGFLLALPIGLLFLILLASAEQFRMYGTRNIYLKITWYAFVGQALVNGGLLLFLLFGGQASLLSPVFGPTDLARLLLAAMQVVGILLAFFNLYRIKQVRENRDSFYYRFQTIEKYQ